MTTQSSEHPQSKKIDPKLVDVPETMLWTLHNRASESKRPDSLLKDDRAVEIYESLQYDYERSFGKPDGSHSYRSIMFDQVLVEWMKEHPSGSIVNLGEGLETQAFRIDNGEVHWFSIDVPEAIQIRERFIQPSSRRHHVAKSALDLTWMDDIQPNQDVFVTAQGLFMYFQPDDVKTLLSAIHQRFSNVHVMFDAIPRWMSKMTLKGFHITKHYEIPPCPWGINLHEIEPTIKSWMPNTDQIALYRYKHFRGFTKIMMELLSHVPYVKHRIPVMVHIVTKSPQKRAGDGVSSKV